MKKALSKTSLLDAYRLPGFRFCVRKAGWSDELNAFLLPFERHQKKRSAAGAAKFTGHFTTAKESVREIFHVAVARFFWTSRSGASPARPAA